MSVSGERKCGIWACVCVCVCVYKHYSAIRKKKILLFVITWVNLESIMLSEIVKQRKTNSVSFHLHMKSKKAELIETKC